MPLFVASEPLANEALPGMARQDIEGLLREVESLATGGVRAVMLFGVPAEKDDEATGAWEEDGIVQHRAARPAAALPRARPAHGRLPLRVHVARPLRRRRRRRDRTTTAASSCSRARRVSHAEAGADIVAPSDMMDGRVARDPRGARRPRLRDDADPRVLREVRLRVLRAVPRGGRQRAVVRRPARLPDGSRQRSRGAARVRARPRGGRRRDHDQAGAAVPRRDPRRARAVRRAARGVQRLGRVRDGQGGGAARAGSTSGRPRSSPSRRSSAPARI